MSRSRSCAILLNAGAQGYVLKSDADRDLVAALEALREGRAFFTSKVASRSRSSWTT
jgi:DNA-binding NarL/FixJ family response regulator